MPYSHYHNGSYHTHRRRRKYGRHYWLGRRRWRRSWANYLLFILLIAIVAGGIVYFVKPDAAEKVASAVASEAAQRAEQRAADKAEKQDLHERHIVTLTNIEREKRGLHPLLWDSDLRDIARSHSKDMAENDYFAHRNKVGDGATERGIKAGYSCRKPGTIGLGENIHFGLTDPEYTVQSWMDSPGHRENMLDPTYDRVGIGIHEGHSSNYGYGYYSTMVLC